MKDAHYFVGYRSYQWPGWCFNPINIAKISEDLGTHAYPVIGIYT